MIVSCWCLILRSYILSPDIIKRSSYKITSMSYLIKSGLFYFDLKLRLKMAIIIIIVKELEQWKERSRLLANSHSCSRSMWPHSRPNTKANEKYTSKWTDSSFTLFAMFSFLTIDADTYLPNYSTLTIYFLKDLLSGRKSRIKNNKVKHISIP